jgi:predicted RNase H-related nuclease YkuK (DUF458 family)
MKMNIEEVKEFIRSTSKDTVIYIGTDSERLRRKKKGKRVVRYTSVVICHIDGKHGARVFGDITYEYVEDANQAKPFNRLWKEAEKVVQLHEEFLDVLDDRTYELHIDVSANEDHGSNIVHNAAVGYIKAMTGITPKVKPMAFAASKGADKLYSKTLS